MAAITVVGDAALDVHAIPSRPLRAGGDVPAEIRLEPGGQGANVAVRLARQGHHARLVCALGTDAAASLLRERLAAERVELIDAGATATSVVVVLRDANGERTMLSQRVPLARALSALPPDVGWLVVSGYLLLEADAEPRLGNGRHRALLGCSLALGEAASWLGGAPRAAPHPVVLNADEAGALRGADLPPAWLGAELAARLDAVVVVTHADGATAVIGPEAIGVPARSNGPAIDATGAGDAFAAGLIGALVDRPWPPDRVGLEAAMATAIELAGAVARAPGAQALVD